MSMPNPANPDAGREWTWKETLADGTPVLIRPVRKSDGEIERAFIEGLSTKAMHNRFFGQITHPSADFIRRMTDIDMVNDVALAAVVGEGEQQQFLGVSRYAADPQRRTCECAVVVADAWQHKGLGTMLMQHLIEIATKRGLALMQSSDLAENAEMRQLARDLGFECERDPDDAQQVVYSLRLGA
jgi:GNAT superfamily N-acetyltransferase